MIKKNNEKMRREIKTKLLKKILNKEINEKNDRIFFIEKEVESKIFKPESDGITQSHIGRSFHFKHYKVMKRKNEYMYVDKFNLRYFYTFNLLSDGYLEYSLVYETGTCYENEYTKKIDIFDMNFEDHSKDFLDNILLIIKKDLEEFSMIQEQKK